MFKGKNLPFGTEKDSKIKLMNERINLTEKHFVELCSVFGAYTRKLARFRDKNDELAKAFYQYSNEEQINKTLSNGMKSFSKSLTIMADYLDIEVHRIEIKILNEFVKYDNICKNAKENLRTVSHVREKELQRQKQLIDIKSKFSANSSAADSELLKANLEVNRTNKQIDEVIENFEKQKLQDLKNILQDFILIQMKQHTKAIELLSATYYDISIIDEKQDFQQFKRILKSKDKVKKLYLREEYRSQSLDSLPTSIVTSPLRQRRNNFSKSSRDLSVVGTDDEIEEQGGSDYESEGKSTPEKDESLTNDESGSDSERKFDQSSTNQKENVFKAKVTREGIPLDSPPVATTRTHLSQSLMSVKSINGVTKYQALNLK